MADARFEDGAEVALRLTAADPDDLAVVSTLVQDAVFSAGDMVWHARARRFSVLLNRFRWEDRAAAEREGRSYERVRSVLTIRDVRKIASQALERGISAEILSVLSLSFEPGADGTGRLVLVLAGDGAIALEVECLNLVLQDVTRPYRAVSGKAPGHRV